MRIAGLQTAWRRWNTAEIRDFTSASRRFVAGNGGHALHLYGDCMRGGCSCAGWVGKGTTIWPSLFQIKPGVAASQSTVRSNCERGKATPHETNAQRSKAPPGSYHCRHPPSTRCPSHPPQSCRYTPPARQSSSVIQHRRLRWV